MKTSVQATWLGHSTFELITPNGKHILIDPFLKGNPATPEHLKEPEKVDYILLTHGHEDHVGDTVEIANRTNCEVLGNIELIDLLTEKHGLNVDKTYDPNKGGTVHFDEFSVTLVSANHSSSYQGDYAGDPGGLIINFKDDICIYNLGDTNIFTDLEIYGKLYSPDIALVPIGDHYTMGPKEAVWATEMIQPKIAIPMHYGTFPVLTGDANVFKKEVENRCDTKVLIPEVGKEFLAV